MKIKIDKVVIYIALMAVVLFIVGLLLATTLVWIGVKIIIIAIISAIFTLLYFKHLNN